MSERSAVQDPMLQYAEEIGWTRVTRSEAMHERGGNPATLYFEETLKSQLIRLNKNIIDDSNCADVLRKLRFLKATLEGNQDALKWLLGEKSIFVAEQNLERNVTLIDFEDPENNLFHVTDEWEQKGVIHLNRADVVFLINGIPIAIVETKSADKRDGLSLGVDQILRYHNETPEMFTTAQLFAVTQLTDLFYSVTWNTSRKNLFNWKTETPTNYEQKVKSFFDRNRILQTLQRSIIFQDRDDQLSKIVLRQHQTQAVDKVIERVNDPDKQRGLIWHTQGSGKTLTMITIAARLLRGGEQTEKPTVLMIVDRNELESQLFRNITAYGITSVKVAKNKVDLEGILASDYRGLVVSMIHKFDRKPANLNPSKNVSVLIDEAHRTTGGNFGTYLMAALPNATYIGFTGTPIDSLTKGEGTFKVFGKDDLQGYLDKYTIAQSIEDGTTLRLNYALAPSELQVDRDVLESEFLNLAEASGVSDPDELNAILDKAINLKALLKAKDRIEKVAQFVAKHFQNNVEPMGFKAFFVAVDREACALYKDALDKYLPAEYSEVVYSKNNRDTHLMKSFHRTPDQEKEIRKRFIDKNAHPKILIVTQKLLTGFDAPILYCMYLDKPMRDHVLLQSIARVNRPYEDQEGLVKPAGLVLDFVGIFDNLKKALAFDSDEVESIIRNIDVLQNDFARRMQENSQQYLQFTEGTNDKAKEKAIEYFADKDDRETFFTFFKDLQRLYNILSPDEFLRPYIEDYQELAVLFGVIRNAYAKPVYVHQDLTKKTRELLQNQAEGDLFAMPNEVYEINETTLQRLKQSDSSDTVKVLNLAKAVQKKVTDEAESNPFLRSIGERAEAAIEAFDERQTQTQDTLAEFMKLAEEYASAARERNQLGLDSNAFAIYRELKNIKYDVTPQQAQSINQIFEQKPNHSWDKHQERAVRTTLYQTFDPSVNPETKIEITNKLMALKRI